jgi:ribose-phosphate pyrophosphokinase
VTGLALYSLNAGRDFGERVAAALGVPLAPHEEREFEDGEHKSRPLESVRGRDVYVVHSLYGDPRQSVNDKLVRLLFFLGALRDAGAARTTAVIPYLCYARKDQRSKPRDPVSTRYVAGLLESVGADRVVTLDVHNRAAYENAFRIPAENLEARRLFADFCASLAGAEDVAVVSPDVGGVKRAEAFRESLEQRLARPCGRAFMEKSRSEGVVSGEALVGDVTDRVAIIIDDLVSSGATLRRAVAACRAAGARRVIAAASHGLFTARAAELLAEPALEELIVTDSVPPFRLEAGNRARLRVLSVAPLFAEAIRRLHSDGSLVELMHR